MKIGASGRFFILYPIIFLFPKIGSVTHNYVHRIMFINSGHGQGVEKYGYFTTP